MKAANLIKFLLSYLLLLADSGIALALGDAPNQTHVSDIECEGAGRTTCRDLIERLGLTPHRSYSDEELTIITAKLDALGYYKFHKVRLVPLSEQGHAKLLLILEEESTARHAFSARLAIPEAGARSSLPIPYAGYGYSDHNFLGKGYFFHGSMSSDPDSHKPSLGHLNAEIAGPLAESWYWTARLIHRPRGNNINYVLGGVTYQISHYSLVTGYAGSTLGINYTYQSEDHGLVPTTGSLFSLSLLGKDDALDARTHWKAGSWGSRQGVLTLSLQSNSILNPAFRTLGDLPRSTSFPETGLTYSLVESGEGDKRSAIYIGLGNGGLDFASASLNMGYKASLGNMDIDLGIVLLAGDN